MTRNTFPCNVQSYSFFGFPRYFLIVTLLYGIFFSPAAQTENSDRIKSYVNNPRYWQYKGTPLLLVGGSVDDNLFQLPNLEEHLKEMVSVGANYIRNTMSARVVEGFEIQPFQKTDNGLYDLEKWNPKYWERLETLLKLTERYGIIVQIELWAFHDFNQESWLSNPWHPKNNRNYDEGDVSLPTSSFHIARKTHPFFETVPQCNNDRIVLSLQQRFVDKILSHTFSYDHVLYCITNEIHPNYDPEWGWYWAKYLKDKAESVDKPIEITEMFWQTDLKDNQHKRSLDHPNIYTYFEASQNSAKSGQENWDNMQFIYRNISNHPRPINHVKIYGASEGPSWSQSDKDGVERFWRNLIGGSASSRFHRPPYGLGLSETAKANIKSFRMLENELDFFSSKPDSTSSLLKNREENEAYLTYVERKQAAIYFPAGGEVQFDMTDFQGSYSQKWLNISKSEWEPSTPLKGGETISLKTPSQQGWICLINQKINTPKQALEWLKHKSTKMIRDSRRVMDDGTAAFPPQVGTGYEAFWLRDYAYMLEGNASAFTNQELKKACRLFVQKLDKNGAGVDCIKFDGTPIYKPGFGSLGENPVADGSQFTVDVAWHTYQQTQDVDLVEEIIGSLQKTMNACPRRNETGLVYIDPDREYDRCPYGFTDTVRKQGEVLFSSLLYVQAARQLSDLFDVIGRHEEAKNGLAESKRVTKSIHTTFWDEQQGLFRAATIRCKEHDIWGSAFAVYLDVTTPKQAMRISRYFSDHYHELVQEGQVRHNPGGVYWEDARTKDTYQNGGFWATPSGWFAYTLNLTNPKLADHMVVELANSLQKRNGPEWIFKEHSQLPGYNASVALPIAGIKRMLQHR